MKDDIHNLNIHPYLPPILIQRLPKNKYFLMEFPPVPYDSDSALKIFL